MSAASATQGVVFIGPFPGHARDIIKDYYTNCPLETIGPCTSIENQTPNRIPVVAIDFFQTFAELVAKMTTRSEWAQIIVCHGNPEQGLIVPIVAGGPTSSGDVIDEIGSLADQFPALKQTYKKEDLRVAKLDKWGVKTKEALFGILENIAKLRARPCIIEFRGCNIGKTSLLGQDRLQSFGNVFQHMVTAPVCRLLYLRLTPFRPGKPPKASSPSGGTSPKKRHGARNVWTVAEQSIDAPKKGIRNRRRFLPSRTSTGEKLIFDVYDYDGHTRAEGWGFLDEPRNTLQWAVRLETTWQGPPSKFAIPVMFDDDEDTFHLPLEPRWAGKLRFIPWTKK